MSFECSELESFFVAKLSDYIGVKHDHSRVFVGLSHQNQPDAPWFDVCFVYGDAFTISIGGNCIERTPMLIQINVHVGSKESEVEAIGLLEAAASVVAEQEFRIRTDISAVFRAFKKAKSAHTSWKGVDRRCLWVPGYWDRTVPNP